jgi:NAD(P)-dependent dehydrogenase (short-subunit alcohol dehydrogenase family)
MDDRPLAGAVAVVTGGGGGIGGGTSRLLARAGAMVVLNDIDAELAASAADDIQRAGGHVVTVVGDIRERATVNSLVETAREAGGGHIDVLVNNVGDYRPATRGFLASSEDDWSALYAINLEHVLRCTHAVLPAMIEQGDGSIVNVSTVEAMRGIPNHAVYSAFNAGVSAFTKSLAVEVARHGVRVNAIAPDMADTLQTPAASMLRGRDPAMTRSWIPLGRFGQPDDYAQVVLFLASDQSRFVTGQTIPVDGGTLAASGWYGRTDGRGWTNLPDRA